jgi:hypothetical protein
MRIRHRVTSFIETAVRSTRLDVFRTQRNIFLPLLLRSAQEMSMSRSAYLASGLSLPSIFTIMSMTLFVSDF